MPEPIYLIGDLDDKLSKRVVKKLYSNREPITIFICTNGGDVGCADAIIDMMYLHGAVTTIAIGKCYSAGALILGHGSTRIATKQASIMLHPYYYELADYINNSSNTSVFFKDAYEMAIKNLSKRCTISYDELNLLIQNTLWLTANKAKKIGLIDKICTNLSSL